MFICIPSYQRAQVCNDRTLSMLHNAWVPKDIIIVYVANQKEYNIYKETLNPSYYGELRIGRKGLVQQREFIMECFPPGERLIFIDDDVERVDFTMSTRFQHCNMMRFFKEAFEECVKRKANIWGIYPVFNPFFRQPRPEVYEGLIYIVGALYGVVNQPTDKRLRLRITRSNGQKEDVERSILYYIRDGIVIRFDKVGFVTRYYGKSGGLGTFDARLVPMKEASFHLKKQYPEFGDIFVKKTGMTEFRLRKRPPHITIKDTYPNV